MDIVINISEDTYKRHKWRVDHDTCTELDIAVAKGVPLPKGHGRLIDADAFIAMMEDASKKQKYKELLIDDRLTVDDVFKAVIESLLNKGLAEGDAPTIIEADKEMDNECND